MGLFSGIKSGLKKVGGVAKKVAPLVGLIPGAGTIAGGLVGGLGSLASGDNIGQALKYGAGGALGATGISKARGLLGGALKRVGGGTGLPSSGPGLLDPNPGSGGLLGTLGGLLGGASRLVGKVGGLGGLADAGLGAASIAGGVAAGKKAEEYRNKALGLSEGSWNDRAGLRRLGISGLENMTPLDLSSIFQNNSNPFQRRVA